MSETADTGKMREVTAPGIREVSVEYGRTVNLGNYETERLSVGLTATVGADDDALTVTYELVEQARQSTQFHLDRIEGKRQAARHRAFRIAQAGEVEE